jgi:putative peptidoglycan lipid II flippase
MAVSEVRETHDSEIHLSLPILSPVTGGTSQHGHQAEDATRAQTHHVPLSRAIRATSGVTLLSRLGGMIREVLLIRLFGDGSALASSFAAGFAIPNLFRRLFGEGALSAAFIPEYTKAHAEDDAAPQRGGPPHAAQLASLTVRWLGLATCALTVVVELALLLVLLLVPHDHDRAVSIRLIMIMLPFMPMVCTAAILAGMLQVHGRFGPASSGPIILNAVIVAVCAYFLMTGSTATEVTAYVLGVATVLSGVWQCAWFLKLLRPHVRWTTTTHDVRQRAAAMMKRFVPVVIGAGALQISTFLDVLLAMWPIWVGPTLLGIAYPLDDRSNIILSAAQRLYQFPLGVFGIAVATAIFPALSRHAAANASPDDFLDTLRRGLRLSFFIALPATLGLILVRTDATFVFYGSSSGTRGFSAESVERSAQALGLYAAGVWAFSLNHVLARAFYARRDTSTPVRIAIACVLLGLAISLASILAGGLDESSLALSTTIAAVVQTAALAVASSRSMRLSVFNAATNSAMGRIVLAGAIMTLCVFASQRLASIASPGLGITGPWLTHVISLALASLTGAASYLLAARLLRLPELRWLLQRG